MIGFLFFLALQPISRKTECHVNLRYVQVVCIAKHNQLSSITAQRYHNTIYKFFNEIDLKFMIEYIYRAHRLITHL